jgi:YjbE family integral membrane protein
MVFESEVAALVTVVVIDLVLAGDNAIVVGMAAAGLPAELRRKAIFIGIAAAAVLRILFALFTTQLLAIIGLVLAGGLLLLWVAWKLWREMQAAAFHQRIAPPGAGGGPMAAMASAPAAGAALPATKTFGRALTQIVAADVSMSLDNVLAVAGTARHHVWVLVIGLALSVALMGIAATMIARLLRRYPWISYLGLALIALVALSMIFEGARDVWQAADRAGMV